MGKAIFVGHFDFLYAYHQWCNSVDKYIRGYEKKFVSMWNQAIQNEEEHWGFKELDSKKADAYFGTIGEIGKKVELPLYDLPSEEAILRIHEIDPFNVTGNEKYYLYFKKIEEIVENMPFSKENSDNKEQGDILADIRKAREIPNDEVFGETLKRATLSVLAFNCIPELVGMPYHMKKIMDNCPKDEWAKYDFDNEFLIGGIKFELMKEFIVAFSHPRHRIGLTQIIYKFFNDIEDDRIKEFIVFPEETYKYDLWKSLNELKIFSDASEEYVKKLVPKKES